MSDPESRPAEKEAGQRRTRAERVAHALIVALPFLVPAVIFTFAYEYVALSVVTTRYIEGLEASYPGAYEAFAPDSERVLDQAAGEATSVGILSGGPVAVSYLTDYRARLAWLTASVTAVIVVTAAIGICAWIIWRSVNDRRLLVAGVIVLLSVQQNISTNLELYAGDIETVPGCLAPCLEALTFRLITDPLVGLSPELRNVARGLHAFNNGLGGVMLVMLGLAAASTLAWPPRGRAVTPAFLAEQMRRGQIFLYTGCTCLTVIIIYIAVWNRWPVELLPAGPPRDDLAAYVTVLVAANGVFASLLLVGAYVPTALGQHAEARKLALAHLADGDGTDDSGAGEDGADATDDVDQADPVTAFLQRHRLVTPLFTQLQRIAAMLVPALVSPLLSAFASLTGI
jgi:hypothetical protein